MGIIITEKNRKVTFDSLETGDIFYYPGDSCYYMRTSETKDFNAVELTSGIVQYFDSMILVIEIKEAELLIG